MINPEYLEKLEQAARAPDDMFPELLFEPLTNDYGDLYFELDFEDFDNEAIRVDPRFTKQRISQIRGTAKRIDQYLEWIDLYDAYVEYLVGKYGSMDIVQEMKDNGILKEPMLNVSHRPILRKKDRRFLKNGIVPSFMAYGVNEYDVYDFIKVICDAEQPDVAGEEEPDIVWALDREPTKEEKRIFDNNIEKYRQAQRAQLLASGAAARGIGSGFDFVTHYYAQAERGEFDTIYSDDATKSQSGIAGQMKAIVDREFMHEGQILGMQADKESGKLFYDGGGTIKHQKDKSVTDFYVYLQENLGIDIMSALSGMDKKSRKAIRADFANAGGEVIMTDKELKKMRKKRKKMEREQDRIVQSSAALAEVLTNNRILMNGGTVRFEDMIMRGGFEDEE